jgi:signal transduction histidine kinase
MSHRLSPGLSEWAEAARRLDELKAVLPALAHLPAFEPATGPRILRELADTAEALRRSGIQDQIQVAGLQEMTESLLRGRDASAILETLVRYIRQVFGLRELLLLRRLPRTASWVGYHAGSETGQTQRLGEVEWPERWGNPEGRGAGRSPSRPAAPGDPANPDRYDVVVPLLGLSLREGRAESEAGEPIGLLALSSAPGAGRESGWRPTEIAHHVESVLEALWLREETERESLLRRQLLEGMRDGLIAFDRDGAVLAGNQAARRFLQLGRDGDGVLTLENVETAAPQLLEHVRRAVERGEEPEDCELLLGPTDATVPTHVAVSRLRDEDGCFAGLVVNLTDLSCVRSMEEQIRRLDRLAALGRFAAGVAHEIRNPLAGIEAGVQYLAGRLGSDPADREDLRILRSEIARLDRIVSELLDYTRPRPLQPQGVRVREVVERTALALAPIFAAQRQELRTEGPRDLVVWADPDRLEQVLINLVKNAAEASPQGGSVRLRWEASGPEDIFGSSVVFRVEDDGVGMAAEQCARAFEPFYTTKGGGSGLGLSLSHAVAEQHGGRLLLQSTPGRGTTARLELPSGGPERMEHDAVFDSRR